MSETPKCGGNALVNYWCVECGGASGTLVLNGRVAGWAHVDACPVPAAPPAPRAPRTFTVSGQTYNVSGYDPENPSSADAGDGEAPTPDARLANMDAALIEHAERIISEMCTGDKWRMSIPVHRHDSDIVLSQLVQRFASALTERATLLEAARAVGVEHEIHHRKCMSLWRDTLGERHGCTCNGPSHLAALRASLSETTNG